ncbi:MAG TPA: 2,3,4,5-tetrahydropyridine-2,6-dicarboxylate N-succinyltransferase, partial [Microbacteriaceae bacterium]
LEAGLYLTAGSKLTLIAEDGKQEIKASELSGKNNLLFRRNSISGGVEALPREGAGVTLNSLLH